jgi:chromosome segregation ATPase
LKEVKEDSKEVEALQKKVDIQFLARCEHGTYQSEQLDEVTAALASKEEAIADLESRLTQVKADLEAALADAASKDGAADGLKSAQEAKEQELEATKAELVKLRKEHEDSNARLHVISQEVYDFVSVNFRILTVH